MTRDRIEPLPSSTGHDGPCQDCVGTYRRTMIGAAIVGALVSVAGMTLAAVLAKWIG